MPEKSYDLYFFAGESSSLGVILLWFRVLNLTVVPVAMLAIAPTAIARAYPSIPWMIARASRMVMLIIPA